MSKTNEQAMFCSDLYSHATPAIENSTNFLSEGIRKILPGEDIPKSLNQLPIAPIAPFKLREKKYFEPQVPDKSGSYDFSSIGYKEYLECCYGITAKTFPPSNASSETESPLSRPATGMNLSGSKDVSPTVADRMKSLQLSPETKRLSISDPEETPRHFHEPFNQKYFEPQVSQITCASEIIIDNGEYNIGDKITSEKAASPIEDSSGTKGKLPYFVPSNCNTLNPSVQLNKNRTESFPSRITEYLNEQNKNIGYFKSRVCDFLQYQIQAIKNGTMFVEKITEYGNFFDSSIFLSQDDLAEMDNSNHKVDLKNVLEHNASMIKYLAEQNLQLSIFSNHAKSWLEKASEETTKHLELVKTKSLEGKRSVATEATEGINESKEKKKVADSSTMTSFVVSENDYSSQKNSRNVEESVKENLLSQDKKIVRVCNVSTMTESAIKMKHSVVQHRKHNLSVESSPEICNSCSKDSRKLNKTCDSSTKTNHVSKRKIKPKDRHSNSGEISDNTVSLHSCDKKSQKVICCNSSTMTDSLHTKKKFKDGKRETSVCIRVTQNGPISCSQDRNKPKQCTTSTMTSNISDFESIVDKALSALVEEKAVAENSEKTTSTLREFIVRCCQTTEEIVENQSLVNEDLGSDSNSSLDSSSNDEKIQLSTNVSDQCSEGHESARSNYSSNSVQKNSMSEELKASNIENDLKHHRNRKCVLGKCLRRDRSSRIGKVGDTSSTSVDDSNKNKEVLNYSKNIEMYGLSTPNLSFATIDYLTRHGLVNTSSKARSPRTEKK